ncbi:MAG TPA: class I SAM-dependent methyltransferase [Pyrinomonadaceae bacterium]|nr:class I SAM-dependent methyltransferase [Pyrinomonadaceae bacterium]
MINTEIQEYANRFTSPQSELLKELLEKTYGERADKSMLSGFYQGRVLSMISHLVKPRRVLEIGTYVGFSALCFAEGLTKDGKIITLDIQPETNKIARDFFARSEYADKIDARLGNAVEIIPTLDETFDLVFIDADKPNYTNYYDLIFPKLKIGGIIAADNVLWSGHVLQAEKGLDDDESTVALHKFNQKILVDERVSNVLMTIRDGLMIIRKEHD